MANNLSDFRFWHFSEVPQCPTWVRNAHQSGRPPTTEFVGSRPDHDPIGLNRIMISSPRLSMISAQRSAFVARENRFPLCANAFSSSVTSSFETRTRCAPQDEVLDPHGEERGNAARLEPRGHRISGHDSTQADHVLTLPCGSGSCSIAAPPATRARKHPHSCQASRSHRSAA